MPNPTCFAQLGTAEMSPVPVDQILRIANRYNSESRAPLRRSRSGIVAIECFNQNGLELWNAACMADDALPRILERALLY